MHTRIRRMVVIIMALLTFNGCLSTFPCDQSDISRSPSPNGEYEAAVEERDCGATTSLATVVALRRTTWPRLLRRSHEMFVATHPSDLSILWKSDKVLLIRFKGGEVFHQDDSWDGLSVAFERIP